jgi:hypothetical protein
MAKVENENQHDPIRLARMVNEVEWLKVENEKQRDPIRLARMVNEVEWLKWRTRSNATPSGSPGW